MKRFFRRVIHWFEAYPKLAILLLAVSTILVIYPRFNRHDISIIKPFVGLKDGEISPDIRNYVHFTEYFKHTVPPDSVSVPYSYRPLVPFLASVIPSDSLLGIVIVNILAFAASVITTYLILRNYGFAFGLRITGCLLFIFSFPAMYYVSAGYIDASAILIVSLIVLATAEKKYYTLPLLFAIGALTKEVIIVALPFVVTSIYLNRPKQGKNIYNWMFAVTSLVFFLAAYAFARHMFSGTNFIWTPEIPNMLENLERPKTYLSFILSLGFVGFFSGAEIVATFRNNGLTPRSYKFTPCIAGIIASLLICIYSVLAAYSDGRFIWTAYPFMIPMSVNYISRNIRSLDESFG